MRPVFPPLEKVTNGGLVAGPTTLRRASVVVTSAPGGDLWVQLHDSSEAAALASNAATGALPIATAYVGALGATVEFDFRDPHRCASQDDGHPMQNGVVVWLSTDAHRLVKVASNVTLAVKLEIRG